MNCFSLFAEFLSEIGQMLCGRADESMLNTLEEDMAAEFVNPLPGKNWREGTQKAYFNYLLLDPRVTQNLPVRARSMGGCCQSPHFYTIQLCINAAINQDSISN